MYITTSTLTNYIKQMGFFYKKAYHYCPGITSKSTIDARIDAIGRYSYALDQNVQIYYWDEMNFILGERPSRAWSRKGQRPIISNVKRGYNYTLILVIN